MGQSKALMEKLLIARSREMSEKETVFCATRYGNVMASRGSVIPLFVNQIKENIPLTITDPGMTRYLMSLEESLDLVMYAFEKGNQGDIFVQKAPSTTISILAEALLSLFNSSVGIETIGTRHGEKLYESLVSREEMSRVKDEGDYFRIPADTRDLNYNKFFTDGEKVITNSEDYTSENARRLEVNEVIKTLKNLDFIKENLNV